jgi:hypothetical protein
LTGFFAEGVAAHSLFGVVHLRHDGGKGYNIGVSGIGNTYRIPPPSPPDSISVNSTHLVIVSYDFVEGARNDVVNLWVDPPVNTFGKTEPKPSATVKLELEARNVECIFIQQHSSRNTPGVEMDEMRVGTTWASVTAAARK